MELRESLITAISIALRRSALDPALFLDSVSNALFAPAADRDEAESPPSQSLARIAENGPWEAFQPG
eukprot:7066626-Pyramimonas_sp.AAC.1